MSRARTVQVGDDITRYVAQNSAEIPIEQLEVYCCARRGLTMGEICAELGRTGIDVVAALSELRERSAPPAPPQKPRRATFRLYRQQANYAAPGYVYFIQGIDGGRIKIGWAKRPGVRLRELQTGSPVALRIVAAMPGDRSAERDQHKKWEQHRAYGEWFYPAPQLLDFINEVVEKWPDCNT